MCVVGANVNEILLDRINYQCDDDLFSA